LQPLKTGNQNLLSTSTTSQVGRTPWTYTYDTENHLLSASKTGTSASYVYDPLHRQIQKTVGTTKSRYVYAGWQRIADYDGTAGTLQNRYVYGTSLDEPLIEVSSSGTLTYFHADRQGSIIATTNSAGAVVNEYKYGPYGESAALVGTTFGFTGQRYDSETGLYHYKRRQYSSTLGRFLSIDPLLYKDSLNLYAYVVNDPVNKSDALGLGLVDIVLGDPELQQLIEQAAQALLAGLLGASAGAAIGIYFPPNVPAPIVTDNQCPMGRSKRDNEKAKLRYQDRKDQGLKKGDPLDKKGDRSPTHTSKDDSGLDLGGADNIVRDPTDGHIISINGVPVDN
jgi:RHS repeat-associated protein